MSNYPFTVTAATGVHHFTSRQSANAFANISGASVTQNANAFYTPIYVDSAWRTLETVSETVRGMAATQTGAKHLAARFNRERTTA